MTESVEVPLVSPQGETVGHLRLACLPGQARWGDLPLLVDHGGESGEAGVQLLEEAEYRYSVSVETLEALEVQPSELFNASSSTGTSGRLRPRRSTGTVRVTVHIGPDLLGSCEVEVRSRKLDYRSDYRSMLARIASESAEAIQAHFSPSSLAAFSPKASGSPETLYQRFAFVRSFLESSEFDVAIQAVIHRPHLEFEEQRQVVSGARGHRPTRDLLRQLAAPGPRLALSPGRSIGGLTSVPLSLEAVEHVESLDTVPNRFVRFALEHWMHLAESVEDQLRMAPVDGTSVRGLREVEVLVDRLAQALRDLPFRSVGRLAEIPASNTVLQGRAGYRDLFRAFFQSEAAALVTWDGGEDVFSAGQRDVATLFEFWCYLELARLISAIAGFEISTKPLFKQSSSGVTLRLRRQTGSFLTGTGTRRGRQLDLELWFNCTFSSKSQKFPSWTDQMRPDCSLKISVASDPSAHTWLHFDAKYRVQHLQEIFQQSAQDPEVEPSAPNTRRDNRHVSSDLLKMHAYRDAIRRSAGAFVLYPGGDEPPHLREMYHELLPGLGAFVFRPGSDGAVAEPGASLLTQFLDQVIDHLASGGTDFERSRYWDDRTYAERRGRRVDAPQPDLPASDTSVLVGFVKSPEHLGWIRRTGQYNLRADDRAGAVGIDSPALAADLVVLYGPDHSILEIYRSTRRFEVAGAQALQQEGYPAPSGELYCLIELGEALGAEAGRPSDERIAEVAAAAWRDGAYGAPVLATWLDLLD